MLETLRKKAKKTNAWRIILSVVGIVILLAVTRFAVFDVITGATPVDITADPASYENRYVTVDADFILYDYIEHTTTTTRKYGGSSTSTNGYSYVALNSVDDYEKQSSVFYFYSIYLNKSKEQEMGAKIDEAWECLTDDTGTIAPPDPVTFRGIWKKMDAQTEKYFRDAMLDLGISETDIDLFYFYELDTKNIGGMNAPLFWVLMAGAALLILFMIFSIIGLFSDSYAKPIQQYLQKDSSVSIAAIEEDFNQAHLIGSQVWVGKKWTIYMEGNKAKILANKNLVWGYYFRRTGRNSVSEMRLFTNEKRMVGISLSEKETHEALQFYTVEQPHMVVGYSAELEKMYNKNFNEFLQLKYNPAPRDVQE